MGLVEVVPVPPLRQQGAALCRRHGAHPRSHRERAHALARRRRCAAVQRLERWLDVARRRARRPSRRYARLLLRSLFEDDELTGELPEEQAVERDARVASSARRCASCARASPVGVFRRRQRSRTCCRPLIGATVFHFASGEFGEESDRPPALRPSRGPPPQARDQSPLRHGLVLAARQRRVTRKESTHGYQLLAE